MRFWSSVVGILSAFGFALGAMQAQAPLSPAANRLLRISVSFWIVTVRRAITIV